MVIQRIQTLYLLIAAVLCAVAAFVPVGHFAVEGQAAGFDFTPLRIRLGELHDYSNCWLAVVLLASTVISAVTIFSYKRLKRQTRLAVSSVVLLVAYYVGVFFVQQSACDALGAAFRMGWTLCLPLVALILCLMAIKAIGHDRKVLRDANSMRLRD